MNPTNQRPNHWLTEDTFMTSPKQIHPFLVLFLFLSLSFSACSTHEEEKQQAEFVQPDSNVTGTGGLYIPTNGGTVPQEETEEELANLDRFQSMLDKAARFHVREEYAQALKMIDQALAEDVPHPLASRFLALRIRVKNKLLRRSYIDAFVRFLQPEYTVGDVIEGEIILMNISDVPVLIPASVIVDAPKKRGAIQPNDGEENTAPSAESRTMIRSEMTYHEFIASNTLVTNRKTQNFQLPKDIYLLPGEFHAIPVTEHTARMNVGGTMYRNYTLRCTLHAAEIRVGDEIFHGRVQFRPATAGVFPRNAEHLRTEPLKRMKQALRKNSPTHLTLAAAFLVNGSENDLDAAFEFLGIELARENAIQENLDGLMMAMVILSGLEETKTKDEWLLWLKNRTWQKKNH